MNFILWSYHIRNNGAVKLQNITRETSQWYELLQKKLKGAYLTEVFVLNTCNRIEVLAFHEKPLEMIPHLMAGYNCTVYSDIREVIKHMLEVALSMDSVVFGENQILGQLKEAYKLQSGQKYMGARISKLLQLILREAKNIRSKTSLSQIQTSASAVAVKWVQKKFQNPETSFLIVGYGEMNKLVVKYLRAKNYSNITITNRTDGKLEGLSYKTISWSDFTNAKVPQANVVFISTSSQHILLTKEILEKLQPKVVVDICIPANASPKAVEDIGAHYLGLDYLQEIIRGQEETAKKLKTELQLEVDQAIRQIYLELSLNSLSVFITNSREKIDKIQKDAQKDLNSLMNNLTDDQKELLHNWVTQLTKKLNHYHLTSYKEVFQIGLKSNGSYNDAPENRNS